MYCNTKRKLKKPPPMRKKRQKSNHDENLPSQGCSNVKTLSEARGSKENSSFSGLNYDLMADLFNGSDLSEVARILNDSPPNDLDFSNHIELKNVSLVHVVPYKDLNKNNETTPTLHTQKAGLPVECRPRNKLFSSPSLTKSPAMNAVPPQDENANKEMQPPFLHAQKSVERCPRNKLSSLLSPTKSPSMNAVPLQDQNAKNEILPSSFLIKHCTHNHPSPVTTKSSSENANVLSQHNQNDEILLSSNLPKKTVFPPEYSSFNNLSTTPLATKLPENEKSSLVQIVTNSVPNSETYKTEMMQSSKITENHNKQKDLLPYIHTETGDCQIVAPINKTQGIEYFQPSTILNMNVLTSLKSKDECAVSTIESTCPLINVTEEHSNILSKERQELEPSSLQPNLIKVSHISVIDIEKIDADDSAKETCFIPTSPSTKIPEQTSKQTSSASPKLAKTTDIENTAVEKIFSTPELDKEQAHTTMFNVFCTTGPNIDSSLENEDTSSQSIAINLTAAECTASIMNVKQNALPETVILQEGFASQILITSSAKGDTVRDLEIDSDLTDCESFIDQPNSSPNIISSSQLTYLESVTPGPSNTSNVNPEGSIEDYASSNETESVLDDPDVDPNFEDGPNNESSESDSDESLSGHSDRTEKVLTRKRKANPDGWKRNQAKFLRNSGQSYKTLKKGNLVPSRTMGPTCGSLCKLKCGEKFTEQERQEYFDMYWSLEDINKQRQVIASAMQIIQPKYKYPKNNSTRKANHAFYFYKEEAKIRVCKKFYVSTLGITNRCIRTVILKKKDGFVVQDLRGQHKNHPKVSDDTKNGARSHIASIPTIESHYTRADSTKTYIEGGCNLSDIYNDYKVKCERENRAFVSLYTFREIFNYEFNLEFFKPKKDLCQFCESYKNMTQHEKLDMELEFIRHHEEKNLSRTEKEEDKGKINEKYRVACFDLQAALPTPKGEVSTFYYKSKLSTYNFTICDLNKKGLGTVNCYLWHEGEGHKGSNEIGSCILHYLRDCASVNDGVGMPDDSSDTEVIFYTDNCGGQGKNKFIIGAYLYAVSNFNIKSITHKFLVVGHTQNEGDVTHSLIEKNIKKALKSSPIYLPSQYAMLVSTARKSGEPFKVHELEHEFFYDLKDLVESTSINFNINDDGEKFNFNDICVIRVERDTPGVYFYKTSYKDEEYKSVNVTRSRTRKQFTQFKDVTLKNAYSDSISISQRKYQDLMSLVRSNTIPRIHSVFFENLKHE